MEPYRLYILNSLNGDIANERQFIANNDETAVWIAEGLQHSRPMELWHGASKIHAWQPVAPTAPAPQQVQEAVMEIRETIPN